MKRMIAMGLVLGCLGSLGGCIAVSAREVHQGFRYEAVVTPDGTIYVVDTKELTARPVREFPGSDDDG